MKCLHLCALAFLAAAVTGGPPTALAQGSTGGNIGKQDKGLSGAFDSPKPEQRKEAPARAKRSGGGGGGGGSFDGKWSSVAVSNNGCPGTSRASVTISGGSISTNDGLSGTVSGSGAMRAVWSGNGMTGTLTGRMSGQSGSGTFKRSDGCSGSWSMVKQ